VQPEGCANREVILAHREGQQSLMRSRADSGSGPRARWPAPRRAPRSPHKARAARAAVRSEATIQLGKSSLSRARPRTSWPPLSARLARALTVAHRWSWPSCRPRPVRPLPIGQPPGKVRAHGDLQQRGVPRAKRAKRSERISTMRLARSKMTSLCRVHCSKPGPTTRAGQRVLFLQVDDGHRARRILLQEHVRQVRLDGVGHVAKGCGVRPSRSRKVHAIRPVHADGLVRAGAGHGDGRGSSASRAPT